jgi:predicted DNA-binding transcriptional regulator AlpA
MERTYYHGNYVQDDAGVVRYSRNGRRVPGAQIVDGELVAPELAIDRVLDVSAVAEFSGKTLATLYTYLSRSRTGDSDLPPPAAMIAGHIPVWPAPIIQQWVVGRGQDLERRRDRPRTFGIDEQGRQTAFNGSYYRDRDHVWRYADPEGDPVPGAMDDRHGGMWAPELMAGVVISSAEVGDLIGAERGTVRSYLSRDFLKVHFPPPVAEYGKAPVWTVPIILRWHARRPRRGGGRQAASRRSR